MQSISVTFIHIRKKKSRLRMKSHLMKKPTNEPRTLQVNHLKLIKKKFILDEVLFVYHFKGENIFFIPFSLLLI